MKTRNDTGFSLHCGACRSSGAGRCRAWPVPGKRRCKWHGGRSTGPRDWRPNVAAMVAGRKRMIERRHAFGLRAPGGRPSRFDDWLRRAVIEEAEKELAGLNIEGIRTAEPPIEQGEAEQLADLEQYGLVLLLDELRLPVGTKNRNRAALRLAWNLADIRYERVERGDRPQNRLDELIEHVATQ